MDKAYLGVVVLVCASGSLFAWFVLAKYGVRALIATLAAIVVVVGVWGFVDWSGQQPRESPFYAYALLAVLPPAALGGWLLIAKEKLKSTGLAILGGTIVSSIIALAIPFVAYVLP